MAVVPPIVGTHMVHNSAAWYAASLDPCLCLCHLSGLALGGGGPYPQGFTAWTLACLVTWYTICAPGTSRRRRHPVVLSETSPCCHHSPYSIINNPSELGKLSEAGVVDSSRLPGMDIR
ncbi:hypothetical protein N658DRAFT_358908 [Parathielavia hyrcaniae]|uniref:Uncharacterized protein n=1 Tax=Parathielavia hyrcaniae TaxID=113614 RepID=A0AAN6Q2B1_9PEZI|nr:hypothetical protein N658DRAFT_358908 [Parathielavia hyrcaniae]